MDYRQDTFFKWNVVFQYQVLVVTGEFLVQRLVVEKIS